MGLRGLHILLAEDNATNQMVAMQMLESLGATISLAADGVEAMELAKRERFDLALIDIEMPRLSGTEVIRRLRAGPPPHCDMPLIALTAFVIGDLRGQIDDAGADGVIAKPLLSIEGLGDDILRLTEARRRSGAHVTRFAAAEPVAPVPPEQEEAIDLHAFEALERAIGPEALPELLRKMALDIAAVRGRIEAGLAGQDPMVLRSATHVLVAVAGSIGATKLQYGAQCLNSAAHSGHSPDIDTLGRSVIAEIDVVTRFLSSKLRR
ncbi:MAG: response regulator [Pseudomonadota bacterium]